MPAGREWAESPASFVAGAQRYNGPVMSTVKEEARKLLDQLPDDSSWRDLLETLARRQQLEQPSSWPRPRAPLPRGASIEELEQLAGILDAESARQMREAIEEGCGRVNPNAW